MTDNESQTCNAVLPDEETYVSALIDGETMHLERSCLSEAATVKQYFYYQSIRQTLRGAVLSSGPNERLCWHESRLTQLWARVDALDRGQ